MGNKIVSDLFLEISACKNKSDVINYNALKSLSAILHKLGKPMLTNRVIIDSNQWLFFNIYVYSKENYENIIHELNNFNAHKYPEIYMELGCLYDYVKQGSINLDSTVVIADPCYTLDTWCIGRLQNILPGNYNCFVQITESLRVANMKIVHEDYDPDEYDPKDIEDCICIGVDSATCGIYDEDYFIKNRNNADWFELTDKHGIICNKAFISASGYGDGSYGCYLSRNTDGQIVGIRVEFISYDEYYEEDD